MTDSKAATIDPAVEAAAKAMWDLDREVHDLHAWEDTTPETRAHQRRLASAALAAAGNIPWEHVGWQHMVDGEGKSMCGLDERSTLSVYEYEPVYRLGRGADDA